MWSKVDHSLLGGCAPCIYNRQKRARHKGGELFSFKFLASRADAAARANAQQLGVGWARDHSRFFWGSIIVVAA